MPLPHLIKPAHARRDRANHQREARFRLRKANVPVIGRDVGGLVALVRVANDR